MTSNLTRSPRRVLRMETPKRSLPAVCEDPLIGPHHRCSHPTPPPPGYRRCAGDPACPLYLRHRRLCSAHEDLVYALPPAERYEELMSAKPPRPIVIPYR